LKRSQSKPLQNELSQLANIHQRHLKFHTCANNLILFNEFMKAAHKIDNLQTLFWSNISEFDSFRNENPKSVVFVTKRLWDHNITDMCNSKVSMTSIHYAQLKTKRLVCVTCKYQVWPSGQGSIFSESLWRLVLPYITGNKFLFNNRIDPRDTTL
jgi:hypothetical protein